MSPQIAYTEPPTTGDEALDRYLLEVHNRIFGLGADTSGDLDIDNGVLPTSATTDSVSEGTTNLYFTIERVDDRTAALIQDGEALTWTYDDGAGTLIGEVTKGAAVSDAAAATATDPAAPTAYAPHAAGAVTVTSNAADDLDTTAAALKTLRDEVATYEGVISDLIADNADIRTQLNAALASLRTAKLLTI